MVSRPGPGCALSEALCPDCAFPCSRAPGRGLRTLAQPPAAWRGVARAHLPSWATLHSAPQAGGGLRPTPPERRRDGKAHSARRGGRRLRLSVRCRAEMRPSIRSRVAPCSPGAVPRRPGPRGPRAVPRRPGDRRARAAAHGLPQPGIPTYASCPYVKRHIRAIMAASL